MQRLHPDYCIPVISARSLLHQSRCLFAAPSRPRSAARAEAHLDKLLASAPERLTGRHVYLAEVYASVTSTLQASGRSLSNELRRQIMRQHSAEYQKLPVDKRMGYQAIASSRAHARRIELNEDIQNAMASLGLARRREREEDLANSMPQCLLSNIVFSDQDLDAMASDWCSDDFHPRRVLALREAATEAPRAPSPAEKAALMGQSSASAPVAKPSAPTPDWARLVCAHRKHFHASAVLGLVGGRPKGFAFLFAMQRPILAMFCPMDQQSKVMPVFQDMSLEQQKAFLQDCFLHEFVLQVGKSVPHHDIAFDDGAVIQVIRHLVLLPGHRVCSDFPAVPFNEFCASLPKAPAKTSSSTPEDEAPAVMNPELLLMYPWLEKYSRQAAPEMRQKEQEGLEADKDPVVLPVLDHDVLLSTWSLLETRRQEWADEEVVRTPDFETFIRGGAHTQATLGVPYDCIISRPCSEESRSWIQGYFATKTAAFAYKRYGEQAAHMLAMGWCHKMQYLFDLFVDSRQNEQFVYQDAELDAYAPDPAYIQWALALPLSSPAYSRHEEIKSLRPRRHKGSSHKASSSSSRLG
jgi:hypothetical protein